MARRNAASFRSKPRTLPLCEPAIGACVVLERSRARMRPLFVTNTRLDQSKSKACVGRAYGHRLRPIGIGLFLIAAIAVASAQQAAQKDDSPPAQLRAQSGPRDAAEPMTVKLPAAVQLAFTPGSHAFHLRGSSAEVIRAVLNSYALTAIASDELGHGQIRFDCEEVDYETAADLVRLATGTLFVPLDSTRVLVVMDTKENRAALQRQLTETLYLPALTSTEMNEVVNIARTIFDLKKASMHPGQATLVVRAPASTLEALNRTLAGLLDGHSQILMDLSLFEVDKTMTENIGIQLPQSSTIFNVDTELDQAIKSNQSAVDEIVSSGEASANDTEAILAILEEEGLVTGVLTEPFAVFGGGLTLTGITFGTVTGNLALNSSDARSLDHAELRVQDNEAAVLKSGSRYPIETSSYTASTVFSASNVSSTTTPQIQYEDLGFALKVTPMVMGAGRVRMSLDLKIEALAGSSLNGIPVLTNRSLTTQLTVPANVATTLVAYRSRQRSGTLDGIPGLNGGTNTDADDDVSELVAVITPHIMRRSHTASATSVILLPIHD
jgi:general secretion pathway protein D